MRILLLTVLLCSGCAHVADDRWTGQDKAEHFFASAALAAAGSEYGDRQHLSARQSSSVGMMFSLSFGVGKEWFDSRANGSGWSWKDLAWDVAGATGGIALWNLSQ
ncbi:MAG: YfiM family lipoprotein [Enterobacterales bacterium endosymbiont of Blomia tropicalis]|uniref:YfiM family lipoprotein n=1 Tax=Mixta mediterraneensis TaxID=2758443 RepID=UPI001873E10C|nr:YfiM family lipoprotein [Mixta mediterraneensis]MBE5252008.1 YfiM family lipoprotein [Mixta mediterraneensis]MDL4915692.1 YfiM family lipoprotein [Mixta mediterraneensis]